jgi:hypothetical protein
MSYLDPTRAAASMDFLQSLDGILFVMLGLPLPAFTFADFLVRQVTGLGTPDFLLLQYTLDYIAVN